MVNDSLHILVTGSRDWPYPNVITEALNCIRGNYNVSDGKITLIHGDCPTGADYQANGIAEQLGFRVIKFPANWKLFGKAAGPIRNGEMVATTLQAEKKICLAFIHNASRGASGTLELIRNVALPWVSYRSHSPSDIILFDDSFGNHDLIYPYSYKTAQA